MNALNVQAEESREIARALGWQVSMQYIESESGTGSHRRCQYEQLLEDMEADKFDIVMIKSIDRLMRSAREWYLFLDKLTRCKKQLYIYIDHKFYTPEDNLITGIKAILAEDFSRELSKKIKNSHRRRQEKKSGLNITVPMFGWDKIAADTYQINEAEAVAYRRAFALAEAGYGFYSIAKIMDEAGVRGKKGKRISDVQWRKMLYSPRAHGTVVLHSAEYDFHTKTTRQLPQEDWVYVENALPPIVSKEYQERVLSGLESRRGSIQRRTGNHLLSGKLFCKACGAVYYRISIQSGGKKVYQWKCSTALREGRGIPAHKKGCNNKNISEKACMYQIENMYHKYRPAEENKHETLKIEKEMLSMIRKLFFEEEEQIKQYRQQRTELYEKKCILMEKLLVGILQDEDFQMYNEHLSNQIRVLDEKIGGQAQCEEDLTHKEKRIIRIKNELEQGLIERAKVRLQIEETGKFIVNEQGIIEPAENTENL